MVAVVYGSNVVFGCDSPGCPVYAMAPLGHGTPAGWEKHGERHKCPDCVAGNTLPPPRPIPLSPASAMGTTWHLQRERRRRLMVTRALWTLAAACAVAACAIVARGCS